METGTEAAETWIPHGGFKLERRKGKTPEGSLLTTDWLVPAWTHDDLTAVHPLAEQPCLHRVLAGCSHDQVVKLAGWYGLLTATGKALAPESVDTWLREIRALQNATALWDAIAGKDRPSCDGCCPSIRRLKGKSYSARRGNTWPGDLRRNWPAAGSN